MTKSLTRLEAAHVAKEKAFEMQKRVDRRKRLLRKFPLWKRLLFFWRFSHIRKQIAGYEHIRNVMTLSMLRLTREHFLIQRRLKEKGLLDKEVDTD